ncbi:MAG: hypothetical protein AB7I35_13145 [Ramlibacter sp.]
MSALLDKGGNHGGANSAAPTSDENSTPLKAGVDGMTHCKIDIDKCQ